MGKNGAYFWPIVYNTSHDGHVLHLETLLYKLINNANICVPMEYRPRPNTQKLLLSTHIGKNCDRLLH